MPRLFLLAVVACAAACPTVAQPATAEAAPEATPGTGVRVPFRPSIAIVVGIFTMIFSLTFLLLMYAKFCHPSPAGMRTAPENNNLAGGEAPGTGENDGGDRASGVVKAVVESLPFFRFAALRGARRGLECAVCLSRFDDADLLRLLPRCRHAFHLDCVDRWLESHASCPLCRTRVDADDATIGLKYSASARFLFGASDRFDESDRAASAPPWRDILDLFIERVPSSRLDAEAAAKAANDGGEESGPELLDRHKHRIVLSDFVFKNRWSDLNSADLIALDSEMLRSLSSGRFASPFSASPEHAKVEHKGEEDSVVITIKEEMEKKRLLESKAGVMNGATEGSSSSSAAPTARMVSGGARSMSEIVNLPRLRAAVRERLTEEERARRLWLPIARRTARWFAGRDRRYVREDVVTSDPCKDEVTDVAAHV